ncbi:MAG: hypothetical protein A2V66_00940 [Ignavibacteria bacterium RBG_13_36_8]|nr:MAG: hypothetical protein A2V66_00940 [Ignavibacteria bacterium RBG_13_36_8]
MMVQGHTVDSLLSDELRTFDSNFYSIWNTFRGFTAPIFMFTSGVVFTYLLRLNNLPFAENPRVKKGFKRFLLLVTLGYLLRYPTYKVFDFSDVTQQQWLVFFAVDALHLIGFGLLFVLIFAYLGEKFGIKDKFIFLLGTLFFVLLAPFVISVDWSKLVSLPLAAYLYHGTGSFFPLFPWAGYVVAGGILGSYLAKNIDAYSSKKFSYRLFIFGISFIGFSVILNQLGDVLPIAGVTWSNRLSLFLYRIGFVLVMNGIMSLIAAKVTDIPKIVRQLGRNTLLIYVIHLIILYGCAWFPGVYAYYSKSMSLEITLTAVVLMIFIMTGMVLLVEKVKNIRKNGVSTAAA